MSPNNNPIFLSCSDAELRNLVEEFVVQQKKEFTFKSLCSFILYWAMEEKKTAGHDSAFRESNERTIRIVLNVSEPILLEPTSAKSAVAVQATATNNEISSPSILTFYHSPPQTGPHVNTNFYSLQR